MSRRANQIAVEQKQELDAQLQEFSTYTEASEEYVENTEQVELSRRYEKMPKPVLIAAYEFEHGEVYFRNPAKEESKRSNLPYLNLKLHYAPAMLQRKQTLYLLACYTCGAYAHSYHSIVSTPEMFYSMTSFGFEDPLGELVQPTWALLIFGVLIISYSLLLPYFYSTRGYSKCASPYSISFLK